MYYLGRLFKVAFYLVAVAAFAFVVTAIWMSFDGLTDDGTHADVALVVGNAQVDTGELWPVLQERLDRVIKLYNDSVFPAVIVSGVPKDGGYDETETMVKYLESKGIPEKVIFADHLADDPRRLGIRVADVMQTEHFTSVMIVGHYYQITRLKVALHFADVASIAHDHIGHLSKADGHNIAREVYLLGDFLAQYYVLPEAKDLSKKITDEAKTGMDKASEDAKQAKESVDKKIDNLAK